MKMVEFFERVSHEFNYQTERYLYRTIVDGNKIKVYRTTWYTEQHGIL